MENESRIYTLKVGKNRVPVNQDVYKAYHKHRERERYMDNLAKDKNVPLIICNGDYEVAYDIEDKDALSPEEFVVALEEMVEHCQRIKELQKCIDLLDTYEKLIIQEIYYNNQSERDVAKIVGRSQQTIHNHKNKILVKLEKLITQKILKEI